MGGRSAPSHRDGAGVPYRLGQVLVGHGLGGGGQRDHVGQLGHRLEVAELGQLGQPKGVELVAKFTALVTKSRGYFASLFPVNSEIAGKALDGATDMLGWSGTGSSCSFQQPPFWPVVNGEPE